MTERTADRNSTRSTEFESWNSYRDFAADVTHNHRYIFSRRAERFIDAVRDTLHKREAVIPKGSVLFRAQRGVDYVGEQGTPNEDDPINPVAYGPERMKPSLQFSTDGRASPAGVPVLYLASTEETAISEVRPWVGSDISLAKFEVLRDLKALNLTLGHGKLSFGHLSLRQLEGDSEVGALDKERAVWIDIDNAFSRPVARDDNRLEYVPTQILADLFASAGFDALIYRSQFGKKGRNVVLFDTNDAEPSEASPHRVTRIAVSFDETGNAWFRRSAGSRD